MCQDRSRNSPLEKVAREITRQSLEEEDERRRHERASTAPSYLTYLFSFPAASESSLGDG